MDFEARGDGIDPGAFWRTLGQRPIGATLVTAQGQGGPTGFLGLSASHVSAAPPTMLVSIDRKTSALAAVLESRHFALNFLPEGCAELAKAFGGKGEKPFVEGAWDSFATGAPVYRDALGVFDCALARVVEQGNVAIVIGTVEAVRVKSDGAPLTFFRGGFQPG